MSQAAGGSATCWAGVTTGDPPGCPTRPSKPRPPTAPTGALIKAGFATGGGGIQALALSGNVLYLVNQAVNVVSTYDATTGAPLKVARLSQNTVGTYNALTGALINANFITGRD